MKPNILVIFADQMRADAMGCAGHPCVQTPNLDRLAAEGVHFVNAYSQAGGTEELYDLLEDPDELLNIAGDPGTSDVLRTMRTRLVTWARENDELSILDGNGLKRSDDDLTEGGEFMPTSMGWRWF